MFELASPGMNIGGWTTKTWLGIAATDGEPALVPFFGGAIATCGACTAGFLTGMTISWTISAGVRTSCEASAIEFSLIGVFTSWARASPEVKTSDAMTASIMMARFMNDLVNSHFLGSKIE
jgi:hypothetical protein